MRTRRLPLLLAAALLLPVLATVGCGEKIAIPVAEGEFGIIEYDRNGSFVPGYEIRDLKMSGAGLHVLGPDRLDNMDINFVATDSLLGLANARALCVDPERLLLFVWEESGQRLSWYSATGLEFFGEAFLPELAGVTALAVNDAGAGQLPWAESYVYLAVPDNGLIHRYAFARDQGVEPRGILARADGDAARFVKVAAGMATDFAGRLLVCDQDTLRNWVIRFDSAPDTTDVTADPDDEDPLRGLAVPFFESQCLVKPAGDFVLGLAPECGLEDQWTGGRTSDADGEFNVPSGVAVDGIGRIFVTDTGNDRVQIFSSESAYELQFGSATLSPDPVAIGVIDQVGGGKINHGAYVFVQLRDSNRIARFISAEHREYLDEEKPIDIP